MSDIFTALNDGLVCRLNRETLFIQAWGAGLRVRATMASSFRDDALSALLPVEPVNATVSVENGSACVTNGDLRCAAGPLPGPRSGSDRPLRGGKSKATVSAWHPTSSSRPCGAF